MGEGNRASCANPFLVNKLNRTLTLTLRVAGITLLTPVISLSDRWHHSNCCNQHSWAKVRVAASSKMRTDWPVSTTLHSLIPYAERSICTAICACWCWMLFSSHFHWFVPDAILPIQTEIWQTYTTYVLNDQRMVQKSLPKTEQYLHLRWNRKQN